MGGALISGWVRAKAFALADILVRDPSPGPATGRPDVNFHPTEEQQRSAQTVVLVVKLQAWRATAAEVADQLHPAAVIVSPMAGVDTADIAAALAGRRVARVM